MTAKLIQTFCLDNNILKISFSKSLQIEKLFSVQTPSFGVFDARNDFASTKSQKKCKISTKNLQKNSKIWAKNCKYFNLEGNQPQHFQIFFPRCFLSNSKLIQLIGSFNRLTAGLPIAIDHNKFLSVHVVVPFSKEASFQQKHFTREKYENCINVLNGYHFTFQTDYLNG